MRFNVSAKIFASGVTGTATSDHYANAFSYTPWMYYYRVTMKSMIVSGLVETKRRFRIRSIFLNRRDSYGLNEARRLTGHSPRAIRQAIHDGEIEATETAPGEFRIGWVQVAAVAVDTWGVAAIEEELGNTHASFILPPLTRMQAITLRLPRYLIAMLEELAKRPESGGVNGIVADALSTLAEEQGAAMEVVVPGFAEALHFPESEWKRTLNRRTDNETPTPPVTSE
jgi:hypothetical protein